MLDGERLDSRTWVRLQERVEIHRGELGPLVAEAGLWDREALIHRLTEEVVLTFERMRVIVWL